MGYVSVGPKYNGQEAYAAEIPAKWYRLVKRVMALICSILICSIFINTY